MKKSRPVLALLQVEDEVRAPSKPRVSSYTTGRSQRKTADSDSDSDSVNDDDKIDELENSCDIGETTLRKGPIHINHTGVTFVSKQLQHPKHTAVDDDDALYQTKRKVRERGGRLGGTHVSAVSTVSLTLCVAHSCLNCS